jgi:hypothetical protein
MAIYLMEQPDKGGETRFQNTRSLLVVAPSANSAKQVADALDEGDPAWQIATSISFSSWEGWTFRLRISGTKVDVKYTCSASDTGQSAWGSALAELLNATGVVRNASYSPFTRTLIVADVADNLGDRYLEMTFIPAGSKKHCAAVIQSYYCHRTASQVLAIIFASLGEIPGVFRRL